jgi:NAD(P)-dependent dehydrogenase (short-subunit alcohol dehydrogenase family)
VTRRVLVTGAAGGLGSALVEAFAERGDRVLATDLTGDGDAVRLDVTSAEDWSAVRERVLAEWGGLDVLVNNAGIAGGGRLDVCGIEEWQRLTDVNLFGVVRGTAEFTPVLKRQRSGHIVNVASLAGLVHPAGMAPYNAVKAAVIALTETTGHELAGWGIRATAVCPSYFRTGLVDEMVGSDEAVASIFRRLVADSPVGPEEIAAATLAGIDEGADLVLPDEAGRTAYEFKRSDRAAYDKVMRKQAANLARLGEE